MNSQRLQTFFRQRNYQSRHLSGSLRLCDNMVVRRLFLNSVLIGVFKEAHVMSEEKKVCAHRVSRGGSFGKVSPETKAETMFGR